MANIKISELNALTERADNDLLAIVDTSADETKKIQVSDLVNKNIELIAVSDTAPSECSIGDKYYNTTNKKIYTATAMNTWSETGTTPISGILYIVYNEQASYSWDGTDLVSVGGGKEDIVIGNTQPSGEDWKIYIDNTETVANTYYNDNGTTKRFSAFDTLPVGAEVNMPDGANVPSGWTEVNNVLYEDSTGTETTVTLNGNTANYDYIEIFYKSANYAYNSVKVPASANYITLQANTFDISNSSNIGIFFMFKEIQNNGTSLTIRSNNRLYKYKNDNAFTQDTTANIQIIKVVGYKE